MATIELKTKQSLHSFKSFVTEWQTFDADADESKVVDVSSYRVLWVSVQWLTADEMIVEWVLAYETKSNTIIGAYDQILDENNLNPFTQDWTFKVDVSPYALIRVRKSGGTDSGVNVQISLSNYS